MMQLFKTDLVILPGIFVWRNFIFTNIATDDQL